MGEWGAAVSLASLVLSDLPGISVLRLMRTLRVLRLFNKLRSLRTLINALAASLFPVLNAFVIVMLILVMYAILGVELFQVHSPESFGTFAVASYTVLPETQPLRQPPPPPLLPFFSHITTTRFPAAFSWVGTRQPQRS